MGLRDKLLNGDSNISLKGLDPINAVQIPLDKTFDRTNLDMEIPYLQGVL